MALAEQRAIVAQVHLNLRPLAQALADIGKTMTDRSIRRAMIDSVRRYDVDSRRQLKAETKIKTPMRLKRGVAPPVAYKDGQGWVGRYRIRDRNIAITKKAFDAKYSPRHSPGGYARHGIKRGPAGATWTSWDSTRTGNKTFMVKGSNVAFIRLRGKDGAKGLTTVKGPNPAQLMAERAGKFIPILQAAARSQLLRQIELAYKERAAAAKARYGL
jgi:hypothetical protein